MASICQERVAAAMAAALAAQRSIAPENAAEMRQYLDKLKDLVPMCPKNRKVGKLELIQHVIDYISDLQDTLQSDSDSDSSPDSPVECMSFSDAYDLPPPAQPSGRTPAGFSTGYPTTGSSGTSDMDTSCSMGYTNGYTSHGYSNGCTSDSQGHGGFGGASSGYSGSSGTYGSSSGNYNSASGPYSPILYSDHGSSPASGFTHSS